MKTIKTITAVLALTFLLGCSTTRTFRPWMLDQVKSGMDKSEVTAILGKPDSVVQNENVEVLHYSYQQSTSSFFEEEEMMNGGSSKFIKARRAEKLIDPDQFTVKLEKGKVVSAGKVE